MPTIWLNMESMFCYKIYLHLFFLLNYYSKNIKLIVSVSFIFLNIYFLKIEKINNIHIIIALNKNVIYGRNNITTL